MFETREKRVSSAAVLTQKGTDWQEGWMYERLMKALSASGRSEAAVSWGKLYSERADCTFRRI